jgi:hypothetical protein
MVLRCASLGRQGRRIKALLVLLALVQATRARAESPSQPTLEACTERVANAAREQGARPTSPRVVDFLLSGDLRSYSYSLPERGCLGFLAVGHRQVQHLGLAIYAPSGRLLVQDQARDAHAYARFCGEGGRRLVVEVRMLDGDGEFHLVPLWNAPPTLEALEPVMASCMHTGDPRPELIDVGPEPLGPPIDVELSSVAKRLGALGYKLEGDLLYGGLPERRREVRRVALDGEHCYALAAVGDGDVEDIDLRLLSVSDTASLVAADVTRRRDAVVKVCPERSGTYVLDVRMYRGAGNYVVQSFNLKEPSTPAPPGVDGPTRIPYAEAAAQFEARGMKPAPISWGLLQPEERQSVPLRMQPGRCYAISALATPDFAGGDLDMSLVDEAGRVLAAEIGPNPNPLLFHCSERGGTVRAVLDSHQIRRPARFLLMLGQDASAPAPAAQIAHGHAPASASHAAGAKQEVAP